MKYPHLTGDASRRIHGARSILNERAGSAAAAAGAATDTHAAAALRGKRQGYLEAVRLLESIESGARMPWRRGRRDKALRRLIAAEIAESEATRDLPLPAGAKGVRLNHMDLGADRLDRDAVAAAIAASLNQTRPNR